MKLTQTKDIERKKEMKTSYTIEEAVFSVEKKMAGKSKYPVADLTPCKYDRDTDQFHGPTIFVPESEAKIKTVRSAVYAQARKCTPKIRVSVVKYEHPERGKGMLIFRTK